MEEKVYNKIRKLIDINILDDFEYSHMDYQGLTMRQNTSITCGLTDYLTLLTNERGWSDQTAWDIISGTKAFIQGMIESNVWDFIYNTLTKQQLSDIIYNNIISQLENNNYSRSLYNIAQYKCYKCEKIVDYVDHSNFCVNC